MAQKNRVNVYFSDEQITKINKLVNEIGCTKTDVVKNFAIFCLSFLEKQAIKSLKQKAKYQRQSQPKTLIQALKSDSKITSEPQKPF